MLGDLRRSLRIRRRRLFIRIGVRQERVVVKRMRHIHSPDYARRSTLAGSGDLRYGYLIGEPVPGAPGVRGFQWDYTIDPGEFRTALEATLA